MLLMMCTFSPPLDRLAVFGRILALQMLLMMLLNSKIKNTWRSVRQQIIFIPLIFLSLGGYSESVDNFITLISNRYAIRKNVSVSEAAVRIRADIAFTVANSQAQAILLRGHVNQRR